MNRTLVILRYPIFASALVGLVTGIWAGLIRIGWWFPFSDHIPLEAHGPLMVSGFLGIVIGLERAVGLNQKWNYLAPALTGIGVLAVIVGLPLPLPRLLITLGSLVFVLIALRIVQIRRAMFTVTMALGALALYVGNMLWMLGHPLFNAVYWWGAFLIFTIAGERLELARIVQVSKVGRILFIMMVTLLAMGLIIISFGPETGVFLTGVGNGRNWPVALEIRHSQENCPHGRTPEVHSHQPTHRLHLAFCQRDAGDLVRRCRFGTSI